MPSTHITLLVRLTNFDTIIETVVDEEFLPTVANINKVIRFLVEDLPQEAQQLSIQQCTAFMEQVCEAGSEADLMRAYLGDMFTKGSWATDLLEALSALTQKELPIESLEEDVSPGDLGKWIAIVASALDTPSITKLVVGTILSIRYWPEDEQELRDLFLSLL